MKRRNFLQISPALLGSNALALTAMSTAVSANSRSSMIELTDFPQLAKHADHNQLPILLLFSAQWCEYCQLLKENVLNPMMLNGMYEGKWVFLRHVGIDQAKPMVAPNGELIKKSDWAYQINADLTPTVLFVNSQGRQVAEPIIGVSEISLYANVIHSRLNQAYENMGLTKRIPVTPELLEKSEKSL